MSSSRYRFSLAARPSAFMSGGPFSPSWRVRSRSWMPIVRWARMSSPPCERTNGDTDMRWSVVSLGGRPHGGVVEPHGGARGGRGRDDEPMPKDLGEAKDALDRIVIPQDALDRIAAMVSPRSSLIISDEALSSETGNGTDFVVVLSGEPQGSLKVRRRGRGTEVRYERQRGHMPYWRSPFGGPYSTW